MSVYSNIEAILLDPFAFKTHITITCDEYGLFSGWVSSDGDKVVKSEKHVSLQLALEELEALCEERLDE